MKKARKEQVLALKKRIELDYVQSFSGVRYSQMGENQTIMLEDEIIAFSYAYNYAKLLIKKKPEKEEYLVVIGSDPRPTSKAIARSQIRGILLAVEEVNKKVAIYYLGVITTPLFESAIRTFKADGGVMITGSHNPLEHNGWKYATANEEETDTLLQEGSLLDAQQMDKVIKATQAFIERICRQEIDIIAKIARIKNWRINIIINSLDKRAKFEKALKGYVKELKIFMNDMQGIDLDLCLVSDANNGSAARVNKKVLKRLGFRNVVCPNNKIGRPGHKIEPIDEALVDIRKELKKRRAKKRKAKVGIVYDFDADRGNLVLLKPDGTVAEISPQDVAALNVAIELIRHQGKNKKMAVVAHCGTSGRTKEIAKKFNAEFFNVEVGEVNVTEKMAQLEQESYFVPIGVEGYNGGTVFKGSKCRDGLQTLLSAAKILSDPEIFITLLTETEQLTPELEARIRARNFYLSDLVKVLPRYESRQDKITGIILSAKEFKVALEKALKKLVRGVKGNYQIEDLDNRIYAEIQIEYSGETDFSKKSIDASVEEKLTDKFIEGGWRIKLVDKTGNESLIWLRGSRTEQGTYRRMADAQSKEEAEALIKLLRTLCLEANQGIPPIF